MREERRTGGCKACKLARRNGESNSPCSASVFRLMLDGSAPMAATAPSGSSRPAAGGRFARWTISPGGPDWAGRRSRGWPRPGPSARWGSTAAGRLWHALAQDQQELPLFDAAECDRHSD